MPNDTYIEPESFLEIKKLIVPELKELLKTTINSGTDLDDTAWNIVRFTSAIIGAGLAVAGLNADHMNTTLFTVGLGIASLLLLVQLYFLGRAIRQSKYILPIQVISEDFGYTEFLKRYVLIDEDGYYTQLINNLVGYDYFVNSDGEIIDDDALEGQEYETVIVKGAIQEAERINALKGEWINYMVISLVGILISLLLFTLLGLIFS